MPIIFNTILREAGLSLTEVRLIRHKDKRAAKGCTPYELWRDNRPQFELYQSLQSMPNRKKLTAPWGIARAVCVGASVSANLRHGFERFTLQNVGIKIFRRLSDQGEVEETIREGVCGDRPR